MGLLAQCVIKKMPVVFEFRLLGKPAFKNLRCKGENLRGFPGDGGEDIGVKAESLTFHSLGGCIGRILIGILEGIAVEPVGD